MRLCFGTFATVLSLCRTKKLSQANFVAKLVRCVDQKSSYFTSPKGYDQEDNWEVFGIDQPISKLLHCTINFAFSGDEYLPSVEKVIKDFEENISPSIKDNKKAAIIITLLEIMRNEFMQKDDIIASENEVYFENYFGITKSDLLHQTSFSFSDFCGRILYYTVFGDVDNTTGKGLFHLFSEDFVNKIAGQYVGEYEWIQSSQTLSMTFAELYFQFAQALHDYQIITFIEETDPTVQLRFDSVEKCEIFIQEIKKLASPSQPESVTPGFTMCKIQEFVQELDKYTFYLGKNMRPISENPDWFVPIFRDENMSWALKFSEDVLSYRERLCIIYRELSNHMLYSPIIRKL